ncbi:hypothetical protein [Photobacterium sanguinicancri]|uniref:hypothetical protein n=1 Tax=Photobacterium sanguinicancri TaxID=875932 RepID=UPI0021C404C1|nr:hypothetical protein [Photobacterium sanguinicancri]
MKPSKPIGKYISGLKTALRSYGATQRDQYSWVAKTDEFFVFTAESDHLDKVNNVYSHGGGSFAKKVRPLSTASGDASLTVSHAKELFDAISVTYTNNEYCKLLIVKGTKYGTDKGGVKAVMDPDLWQATSFSGSVEGGFEFQLDRTKEN